MPALASAQHKKHHKRVAYSQAVEDSIYRKHFECFYSARYTAAQRSAFYPFNKAVKVQLIRFSQPTDVGKWPDTISAEELKKQAYLPLSLGGFKGTTIRLRETLFLTQPGIDTLTDILYNYSYTPVRKTNSNLIDEPTCYEPRNAILFIDADGKVIAWMEYCFTCSGYRHSSTKINYDFCNEKYEMLRKFFFDRGLTRITRLEK